MRLLSALFLLPLLVACGETDDKPSDDSASSLPACSEVWQVGQTLPKGYEGCSEDDGATTAAVWVSCVKGRQFTSYDDAMFAFEGGEIVDRVGDVADLRSDCDGTPRIER